jgi:uncharacterized glyoxalase superfamily protein PhnB
MLKLGGATIMLNTKFEDDKRPPQPPPTTGHEDVCLYFGCDDVDAMYELIRSKWQKLKAPKNAPYGMRQLYLNDPDGYELCFQEPVP